MAYEYPFNTFPLANKVRILNPAANLDARYGPWSTLSEALSATENVRQMGLTVAVSSIATGVVEYHFKNGISNNDLVVKTLEIGNLTGYLPISGGNVTGNLSISEFLSGSNVNLQNNIQVEGEFLSSKAKPQGRVVFRDAFTELTDKELTLHAPNFGSSPNWTRIYETNTTTRLTVIGGQNEIKSLTSPQFQGVIYRADAAFSEVNNEVKVLCKEISPVDSLNFDVFWLLSRVQNNNNFYAVRFGVQNNDCAIYKKVAGVFTLLKQLNVNFPSRFNFYLSLRVHGNNISVLINDNLIDSVTDNSLAFGNHGIALGNIGVRGNDSVDTNTRLTDFTITVYNGFEKDSYINQNNFGVGTKTPNEKLTVVGNISSNNLIYALGGNSQQWNSNFATVCSLSSIWNSTANNASVYSTVNSFSANWRSGYSTWNSSSASLIDARTFNNNNSSTLIQIRTEVLSNSANWNSSFSTLCTLSGKWSTPYDTQLNVNSTNAVENSAIAVRIVNLESSLSLVVPPTTYSAPEATLSNYTILTYEVGELVTQNLTYGWIQGDAGPVVNPFFRITKNGSLVSQTINAGIYSISERATLGGTNYQNNVTFSDGPIKNNILGLPDSRGRILSGSVSSPIRSYIGYYRQFFGSVTAVPTNLRSLTGNNFAATSQGNQFSFFAYNTANVVVIPFNRKISFVQTQNFQEITTEFTNNLSNILLPDANNVSRNYKRYVQTTAVPLNLRIDFTITSDP